jgi:hypothetical protein
MKSRHMLGVSQFCWISSTCTSPELAKAADMRMSLYSLPS